MTSSPLSHLLQPEDCPFPLTPVAPYTLMLYLFLLNHTVHPSLSLPPPASFVFFPATAPDQV